MPIDVYTAGQILGKCLRDARIASRMTGKAVGAAADMSPATISRLETGTRSVTRPMLEFLVELYGIDPEYAAQLEAYRVMSRSVSPFDRFRQSVPESLLRFYSAQSTAVSLREFTVHLIPKLLRTDGYQEAMTEYEREKADVEDWRHLHTLARDLATDVQATFILAEESMGRLVGGYDTAAEQIDALHDAAADERIQIRVIPYSAGLLPATRGFTLLNHDEPDDEVSAYAYEVFDPAVQMPAGFVSTLLARWTRLEAMASKPDDLDRMLGQALTRLKDHQRTPS